MQRVRRANVEVDGEVVGAVEHGLCVFLGVARSDSPSGAARMAAKIARLRIFADDAGKMNRSLQDIGGSVLLISQFTLLGDATGGNRPSFVDAAVPEIAEPLFAHVAESLRAEHRLPVALGRFRHHMLVRIENDGPVTITLRVDA
ncbi:MAG: D-aminoacyl-tRNA deacylase [Phycisphaerales bacterium]